MHEVRTGIPHFQVGLTHDFQFGLTFAWFSLPRGKQTINQDFFPAGI